MINRETMLRVMSEADWGWIITEESNRLFGRDTTCPEDIGICDIVGLEECKKTACEDCWKSKSAIYFKEENK